MRTEVLTVDADRPDSRVIERAAAVLRAGGLVAFPTETVYGLGADAGSPAAVAAIFRAKGRPANNPLIVHAADADAAVQLVASWPESAARLAAHCWPGPLTLVLPRGPRIPDVVTAGGPTVAVRVPAHPVALALVRAAGVPLAAPSANRSGYISPTRPEHVLAGLDGLVDVVLDAGPVPGGIESTVLDLTSDPPRVLRPGLVTAAEIAALVGPVAGSPLPEAAGQPARSPGLLHRHYAPRTPLELSIDSGQARIEALLAAGLRIGWLTFDQPSVDRPGVTVVVMPRDPDQYAARLYAELHEMDAAGLDRIVAALPPDGPDWLAVRDRLRRAAAS
jgi:L-threonylcarbamoyladenylate synthase